MAHVRIIKKGMSREELQKILDLSDEPNDRGIDAKKHLGSINWKIEPVDYQKNIRKEWDREIKFSSRTLSFADSIIAATAFFHNYQLITADTDFMKVDDLYIAKYEP